MKRNIIIFFTIVSVLAIWQNCTPKKDESKIELTAAEKSEATAKLVKLKTADEVAATRAKIAKARAEREEQRKVALLEKAKATPTYKDASGKIVYYKAEVDPTYAGGFDELTKYLKDNLKYPEAAREKGHEGTVFVDFIVDEKGRIRDVVASDVVGEDVDLSFKEESVRVVAAMQGWTAGRQHGKPVDASFSIPITFQIAN
jgi:TonB family protein